MEPVTSSGVAAEGWRSDQPLSFQLALAWRRHGPIGKSAIPRMIGRTWGKGMRTTIPLASGARLAVDPSNLDVFTNVVANGGWWDRGVTVALCSAIRDGDVVYDIGANAGAITMEVAGRFRDRIKLFAFEPIPSHTQQIAVSVELNDLGDTVKVYEALLGEESGTATLYVPSHSIHASMVAREADAEKLERPIHRLDDLVARGELPAPDVIKIDVEGAELSVFKGALQTFKARPPVILMEADDNMARFNYTRADLLGLLRDVSPGYRFQFVDEHTGALSPLTHEDAALVSETRNILALPPGRDVAHA